MKQKKRVEYLHGFSKKEQMRLYEQAQFLEREVYESVDLSSVKNLIEIGCGVGAQTKILLKRYPQLHITGIDASTLQLEKAEQHLIREIRGGKASFHLQNALNLDFKSDHFDGAFLCWFLEHVPDQLKVLKEARRVMKKGSVIYCSEIQNASLFVEPYSPALLKYWFLFNDQQWLMRGDPFVGAKLGNLLKEAGFRKIEVEVKATICDSRNKKKRSQYVHDWTQVMLSAAPSLLKSKRVTPKLIAQMKEEIAVLKRSKDSVIFSAWVQAKAIK